MNKKELNKLAREIAEAEYILQNSIDLFCNHVVRTLICPNHKTDETYRTYSYEI